MVSLDRHIAIQAGWVAGPAFGIAMMAAPEYLHLGPMWSALLFWGGIGVFILTLIVVVVLALHEKRRRKSVTSSVIMMAIGALIFFGGAAWYFWPMSSTGVSAGARPSEKAQPPKSEDKPAPKKADKPTVVDEADLIGTARLLYNADENRLDVLKYEKIRSVAVEPVVPYPSAISYAQSFRITFAFYAYQGPFDVRINTTGYNVPGSMQPGLSYVVTENEDRFVIVTASRGVLSFAQSHEAFFRFYRKH